MSNRFNESIDEEINAELVSILTDSISEITNHEIPGAEKKQKKITIFYILSVKSVILSLLLLFYFVIKYNKKLCFKLVQFYFKFSKDCPI